MPDDQIQSEGAGVAYVKTVLVVEDDADIGSFIVQVISQETTHHAFLVTDGFQALKVLHDLKPNLLIIDYQLPNLNGIELYDRISRIKGMEAIPTIMMSARLPTQEIVKRKIVGMQKPFELQDLLNTIERLLALQYG
jgi:DNA-binding response OmpR family regulator